MSNESAEMAAVYAQRIMELEAELKRRNEQDAKRYADSEQLQAIGKGAYDSIADMVAAIKEAAGERESREDAEWRILEDPLSIELAGKWSLGKKPVADRAYILLGTGGPATRIVCELDDGEPTRAWIQAQDWGTPWTDYVGGDSETLLTYCRCFYFGED